ncbi:MAG: hypothetical protein QNJ37_07360 [Crocosphaera sp.]|nr:hypothetical protein [Crocosphaera sp.]
MLEKSLKKSVENDKIRKNIEKQNKEFGENQLAQLRNAVGKLEKLELNAI